MSLPARNLVLTLALTALLVMATLVVLPATQGAVHTVGPGESIQDAIDLAGPGDIIIVSAGLYEEQITIDMPLTLRGAGPDTVIDGPDDHIYTISVVSDGVTIETLTVQNPDYQGTDQTITKMDPTLIVNHGDGFQLRDVVLRDPVAPTPAGESRYSVIGLNILAGSAPGIDDVPDDVVVERVTFHSFATARGPDGTCLNEPCSTVAISHQGGDGFVLRDSQILISGGGCPSASQVAQGGCWSDGGRTYGLITSNGLTNAIIENNVFDGTGAAQDGSIGATDGIRGSLLDSRIQGNSFSGFVGTGTIAYGNGLEIVDNSYVNNIVNAMSCNGQDVLVRGNDFGAAQSGFALTNCGGLGTVKLRENVFSASNLYHLEFRPSLSQTTLDARLNSFEEQDPSNSLRVLDPSGDNIVLAHPYLQAGNVVPPMPRISDFDAADCAAHPEAELLGNACRAFTIDSATAVALPGTPIVLPASASAYDAMVIHGDDLMLCSGFGGAHCLASPEPGHFQTNGMSWKRPPVLLEGEALKVDLDVAPGSTSLFPAPGVNFEDIEHVSFDWHQDGTCSAGSPRVVFAFDEDGNGVRDPGPAIAYFDGYTCPEQGWISVSIIDKDAVRWHLAGHGTGTDHAAALAALSGKDLFAINIQVDTPAGATTWIDNHRVNDHLLGEQSDQTCYAQPATCRTGVVIIDGGDQPAITVRGDRFTLDGFTLVGGTSAIDADGTSTLLLRDNTIRANGNGILLRNVQGVDVIGNTLIALDGEATDSMFGLLVSGGTTNYTVTDNTFVGFSQGTYVGGSADGPGAFLDNVYRGQSSVAMLLEGTKPGATDALEIVGNTFVDILTTGIHFNTDRDVTLRQNTFDMVGTTIGATLDRFPDLVIDARLNDFGTDESRLIEPTISKQATQIVHYMPMLVGGVAEPALPQVSNAIDAADCAAHPDAELTPTGCLLLSPQAAVDLAALGSTVLLGRSASSVDPNVIPGDLRIDTNIAGAPLHGLTVCSGTGGPLCADQIAHARHQINGFEWIAPAALHAGQALHFVSDGSTYASTSTFPGPTNLSDVGHLGFDVLLVDGMCGAGVPRISLGMDTDADGARDANIEVYPDYTTLCGNGHWQRVDLIDAGTWGLSQIGGPSSGTHADALTHAEGLSIVAVNLQYDPLPIGGEAYFDNIVFDDRVLGEPADQACGASGIACRESGASAATVIAGTGGRVLHVRADDVTVRGITLRNEGLVTTNTYGAVLDGDRANLTGNRIILEGGGCGFDACYGTGQVTGVTGSGADVVVRSNRIIANVLSIDNEQYGGTNGITGTLPGAVIQDNRFSGWVANGIFTFSGGQHIRSNIFTWGGTGVLACQDDLTVVNNLFLQTSQAVAVCGTPAPDALRVNQNTFTLLSELGIVIRNGTVGAMIDAECNDWGVYQGDLIRETRIHDENTPSTNVVDSDPFVSPHGAIGCLAGPSAQIVTSTNTTDRLGEVRFTDASTNGDSAILLRDWDFGDGTTSAEQDPVHTYTEVGTFEVTLTVKDLQGMTDTETVTIVVDNLAPVLDPIDSVSTPEGSSVEIPFSASDPEGDALSLGVAGLPVGATATDHGDGTATITWTPPAGSSGVYPLVLEATDSHGATDNTSLSIVVGSGSDTAPVVSDVLDQSTYEGGTLSFEFQVSDADGDDVVVEVVPMPTGATLERLNATHWRFTWTPGAGDAGTHQFTVRATGEPLTTEAAFTVEVADADLPPVVGPLADRAVPEASPTTITISAFDPDGDAVTLSATGLPAGAMFTQTDARTGSIALPGLTAGSTHTIAISAEANGLTASDSFVLDVVAWAAMTFEPVDPSLIDAAPGQVVPLTALLTNDGPTSTTFVFGLSQDRMWADQEPVPLTLTAGESRLVTANVTVGQMGARSLVTFSVAAVGFPGVYDALRWVINVPVVADVTFTSKSVALGVSGIVETTYIDGSPAPGTRLDIVDTALVSLVGPTQSRANGVSDATGRFAFDLVDQPASHTPGAHAMDVKTWRDSKSWTYTFTYDVLV